MVNGQNCVYLLYGQHVSYCISLFQAIKYGKLKYTVKFKTTRIKIRTALSLVTTSNSMGEDTQSICGANGRFHCSSC